MVVITILLALLNFTQSCRISPGHLNPNKVLFTNISHFKVLELLEAPFISSLISVQLIRPVSLSWKMTSRLSFQRLSLCECRVPFEEMLNYSFLLVHNRSQHYKNRSCDTFQHNSKHTFLLHRSRALRIRQHCYRLILIVLPVRHTLHFSDKLQSFVWSACP